MDLNYPIYTISAADRHVMTYANPLSVAELTTEGWSTALGPTYHGEPRLYFAIDLGTWMMTYFELAVWYGQTSGVYTFYSFINCIDGCDGLLYIDTCGTHIILLECVTAPAPVSSSSSSLVPSSSSSVSSSSVSSSSSSVSSSSSSSLAPPDPLPTDAVFYSHLDGDMSDSEHDITLYGGVVFDADGGAFDDTGAIVVTSSKGASVPYSAQWNFGSNDFTIELIVKFASIGDMDLINHYDGTGDQRCWSLSYYDPDNTMRFYWATDGTGPSVAVIYKPWAPVVGTEYRVMVVRSSNTLYMFVNGALIGSGSLTDTFYDSSADLDIGVESFDGSISEVRISDSARYVSGFTPNITPYENDANTLFLWHANGDISNGAHDITTIDGQVINSGGGATNFNGVMTFDGTGDYLSIPDSDNWYFGSDDFAISFKLKFTGAPSVNQMILAQYEDANNLWYLQHESSGSLQLFFRSGGTVKAQYNSGNISLAGDTDYHIAIVRDGPIALLYIDGVSTTFTATTAFGTTDVGNVTALLLIGAYNPPTTPIYLKASLNELLIIKGSDNGWTGATIDVPTQPYGPSSSSSSSSSSSLSSENSSSSSSLAL